MDKATELALSKGMMECECEHVIHFTSHRRKCEPAKVVIKTIHGHIPMCQQCIDEGHMIEYPGSVIVGKAEKSN